MLDFQKLDPFWNLWSKPNQGISSNMLYPARLNHNLERNIGHEIFVKTEKTEYLSNQLTSAHFDRKFIFPIKGEIFLSTFGDYLRRKRTLWHVLTSNLTFFVQKIITQPRRGHFFRYYEL